MQQASNALSIYDCTSYSNLSEKRGNSGQENMWKAWRYSELTKDLRNYSVLVGILCTYITVCTLFYTCYEKWEASVAMFFVFETMTAVGNTLFAWKYGKPSPFSLL
jgi:hypothetical protein